MSKVIVVGGGAAGMMCAVHLSRAGHQVTLLEKNEKLGKKLFITGKGRCNLTNACDTAELFQAVVRNPKFLYSAFYTYDNQSVMHFFEQAGVKLKVERGNRVFPESDHSSDIIRGLERELKKGGVKICLHTEVKEILTEDGRAVGVVLYGGKEISADAVIVATGGISYRSTGATGDGYAFAKKAGLKVIAPKPSLVPLTTKEYYIPQMQGLSLRNTGLTIRNGKKVLYKDFGEMMFTHCGVTGPMILSASAKVSEYLENTELEAYLDLKPALTEEQLDARILREFEASQNKQFKNVIGVLFPSSLTPVIIELSGIDPERVVHEITRQERKKLVYLIKSFPFTITGTGEFREAIITRGGVSVKEIDPGTMESKKIKGLYFIGEVLDLDAVTGGFNLQIAWSTAYMAAVSVK
ncbi:MAG: NAD(P)/FAD-dependent oxidoreductase [Blautia sp.]|nr:NAD(P)/FAD-dependent oxidoreductase [Blautia sp.]